MRIRNTLDRPAAEDIALKGLIFLTGDPERLARFLALTGLGPDTIRAAANSPGFLAGVLDHIAASEDLLIAFGNDIDVHPETIVGARRLLAPREDPE